MKTNKTSLVTIKPNEDVEFKYIGYTIMLDKICSLMDKVSYENKMILIDKYIEILKEVKNESN